jgi:hypothetical protein
VPEFPNSELVFSPETSQSSEREKEGRMSASIKKLDLKKELKQLYKASQEEVSEVVVPTLHYLVIDGQGDPDDSWHVFL